MMSRIARSLTACALALTLGACSSAPIRFYTLVPPSSKPAPAATAPFLLDVPPVSIPAQVDQPQIVVRDGNQGVALLEGSQWVAPLASEIRNELSDVLVAELDTQDIYGVPHADDRPVYRVRVNVRRFDSVLGGYARIDATWSVRRAADPKSVLSCSSSLRQPVGAGMDALVHGHQKALEALAGQIAGVVRAMAGSRAAHCPAG